MRRDLLRSLAVALVAATALAGCSVDVEGATCRVAGSTADCPAGQRCGTDLTCSVRAAGCAPCAVGALDCRAGQKDVMACSADGDPACGTWTVVKTCAAGLQTCQVPTAGGAPDCACERWTVVPGGSASACTKPSITRAIAEAVKFPDPLVFLGGAAPATYGNELDDQAPIVIKAGVTMVGDENLVTPAPTNQVIAVQGAASVGLEVQQGASVRGVAVRRGDPAGPTTGVLLTGGVPGGIATLSLMQVDALGAGGAFATGISVAGSNEIILAWVRVEGATSAGVEVNRLGASDPVLVTGSTFDQNHVGVSLLKGALTLSGSNVKRSTWEGVVAATGNPGQTSLALSDGVIAWNGRGGVRLSVNDSLSILRTRICGNTGFDRTYGGVTRTVGGLFTVGNPPAALMFRGNFIHHNGGDQVYVGASNTPWDLNGAADCAAAARNVFAGYAPPGVGVAAVGAPVLAVFNSWAQPLPVAGADYYASPNAPVGSIDAGTVGGATDVCGIPSAADLVCPAP